MFWAAVIWGILILSINEVYPLRGALIRNGRAYDESNGNSESISLLNPSVPSDAEFRLFYVRPFQEFMRFGRSSSLPGAHQNFFRGRRDVESKFARVE